MRLRWSRHAATQLFEAADYLERARRGAGDGLYTAVDRLVALIKDQPRAFPREPHAANLDVRRALVVRYGYWIVYCIEDDEVQILVLAFWSTRRRPGGWMR